MKQRLTRILLSVAIGLGLLAGGIWLLTRIVGEHEELYRGKSRYYWSEQIKSRDAAARNEATQVLNQEIIPRLTKAMFWDTNDSRLRIALVDGLNSLPGVDIIFREANSRRADATTGLGEFGPAADAAIPALLQAMLGNDPVLRGLAAVSLGKIHAKPEAIIPLLIKYLDDDDLRENAAEALGEYGSLSKGAVPKLVLLFKIPDKDLRHAIYEALKNIDSDAAAQVSGVPANHPPAGPKTAEH